MHKEQLTQCEGDVITHAHQLPETYRASIFVDPQLCNPARDKEWWQPSNALKRITWWMHDRSIYRAIAIMPKEVRYWWGNLSAETAQWANMFFAKETRQKGISDRKFSSPFASKSHRLLVVGGYNHPVALGILGNGIQHHVERSIVTSQTQAKGYMLKRASTAMWTCLSAASSSTCRLCPPSCCGWGAGGPLSLPASSLYPCRPPVPASHPDRTPPPETDAELPTQETWTPDRKQQKKPKQNWTMQHQPALCCWWWA